MKKKVLVPATALAMMLAIGSASAEDTAPISEIPLEEGIVIDATGGDNAGAGTEAPTTDGAVQDATVTEDVTANNGATLPLDQGEVNGAVEEGTVTVDTATQPQPEAKEETTVAPQEDTVILTEKVEELPKTGLKEDGLLYATLALVLGGVALVANRFFKSNEA